MAGDDSVRLRHMLDAAREAMELAKGKTGEDIENNRMLNLSLVRLIEVVGEAANRVSAEGRARCPEIPWPAIIGMRNRMIHGYDSIDFDILYKTINEDLPSLAAEIEKILQSDD